MASGLQVFQFSTASHAVHERIAAWREGFGRTLLQIDVAPRWKETFEASATAYRCSSLGVLHVSTSAAQQANSKSLISNDNVCFGVVTGTPWRASQLGRHVELSPGDGLLMSNCDVGSILFPNACQYVAFSVPRSKMQPLVRDINALFARRTPASNPALQMLLRYLELVRTDNVVTTLELEAAFVSHVCDLLALAIGATPDAAEFARTQGLRAALLHAMQDDVRQNFCRPNLSVQAIAARHGVSARYVQKLFERGGSTFTQFVTEQRLTAAHKALTAWPDKRINMIAYDVGFNDLSHFNRAFRQRFGCTPGDIRGTPRSRGGKGA